MRKSTIIRRINESLADIGYESLADIGYAPRSDTGDDVVGLVDSLAVTHKSLREAYDAGRDRNADLRAKLAAAEARLAAYQAVVRIGDRRVATRSGSEVEVVSIDPVTDSIGVRFVNPYNERTPHRWFTRQRVAGWALATPAATSPAPDALEAATAPETTAPGPIEGALP